MGRLIDADALIKELVRMKESCVDVGLAVGITHAIFTVDEQSTAYDVENVVAELEELEQSRLEMHDWQGQSVASDAIDIVKRGGVK